jgi:hypothetical protein
MTAISRYSAVKEGKNLLARFKEFPTHHFAQFNRALLLGLIIQLTNKRNTLLVDSAISGTAAE